MHDLPRQKLRELLAKHGHSLCDDARRVEGLLKDALRNEHKRETFVLISALRDGVAHELRGSTSGMPVAALAAKLVRQLCDNLALDEAAAHWSVESWAVALGVQIPDLQSQISNLKSPISNPSAGIDLAALALQHRAKAQQDQVKAAQGKAHAVQVQKQARELAEQTRDFAAAARMLEEINPQWRDAKLYESICGYRGKVKTLDEAIQRAVHKGRLRFLRGRVQGLLKLQPKRDDMRRLLDVLPDEPELLSEFTNSIGMKFVLVEPGEFMMGSSEADSEMPAHMVEITQPYYLSVFPVTQREYQAVVGTTPIRFTGDARMPVEQVNWHDAVGFCKKLQQLTAEVQRGMSYRLPSEAEWEYACRAGLTGKWCCGDQESQLGEYAWLGINSGGKRHQVGLKKPNAWGLHDMHGNVYEWCQDNYGADAYKDRSGITQDPLVKSGLARVVRGGSWSHTAGNCRSAYRFGFHPSTRSNNLGFRLALSYPSGQ